MTPRHAAGTPDSRRAWLVVAAAFIAGFVAFGVMYSFGAFLAPMSAEFRVGHAQSSTFFSATGVIFYLAGSMTGRLSDRFGPRILAAAGAAVLGGGLALTAFIEHMWVGYLTYGIGVGVGAACAYVPTLAVVGGWFSVHRSAALGIAAAGTGCGMLAVPPVAAWLIACCGWRVANIALAASCGLLLALCAWLVRPAPSGASRSDQSVGGIVRSPEFAMLYASWVLATTALFVPFVFLPAFARELGADPVAAAGLLSLIGAVSVLGRLGMGALGNRIGTARLFKVSVLMMAASYVIWLAASTYGALLLFAAVLGLGYGLRIALMPAVLIELYGLQNIGAVLGAFFTASGISAAVGPPLAGLIVDWTGSYHWGIGFALMIGSLGFAAIVPLRMARAAPGEPQSGSPLKAAASMPRPSP